MKALNEAYRVLHDDEARSKYDSQRRRPAPDAPAIYVKSAVREVGIYGQLLSALLCLVLGLMLLLVGGFGGLCVRPPFCILVPGVILWVLLMEASAMQTAHETLGRAHAARRLSA